MPEMANAPQRMPEMQEQYNTKTAQQQQHRSNELSSWGEVRELPAAPPGATVKDVGELSGMEKYNA